MELASSQSGSGSGSGKQKSIHQIYFVHLLPSTRTPYYIPSLFAPYRIRCLLLRISRADVLRLDSSRGEYAIKKQTDVIVETEGRRGRDSDMDFRQYGIAGLA